MMDKYLGMHNFRPGHYPLSLQNRNINVEERFNLHIGKPYRLQVQTCVYDGIMTECRISASHRGFTLLGLTLENGLFYHPGDTSQKFLFDHFRAGSEEIKRMGAFGSILDIEGFVRARDREIGKIGGRISRQDG
jgi:hypothetical protein